MASWLERYPPNPTTDADRRDDGNWTVRVWSGEAGQIALGVVDDAGGRRDRGLDRAAGRVEDGAGVRRRVRRQDDQRALGLARVLRGLPARPREPAPAAVAAEPRPARAARRSRRPLYFFNRGEVFWSVPLAIPPLLYVIGRLAWIGARGRPTRTPPTWPAWVLLAATVFLLGFRIGLNVQAPYSVIDVGYAGVIGAHRIANGEAPYGHFPVQDTRPACGPADAEGEIRNRDPDEWALRVVQRARRHVRAGLVSRLRPRVRALRVERQVGRGHAAGGALHRARVGPPHRRGARPRRTALRRELARGGARVRLGRLSVHAVHVELEHERRDPGRRSSSGGSGSRRRRGRAEPPWRSRAGRSSRP